MTDDVSAAEVDHRQLWLDGDDTASARVIADLKRREHERYQLRTPPTDHYGRPQWNADHDRWRPAPWERERDGVPAHVPSWEDLYLESERQRQALARTLRSLTDAFDVAARSAPPIGAT